MRKSSKVNNPKRLPYVRRQTEVEALRDKVDMLEEHVKYLSATVDMLFSIVQTMQQQLAHMPTQPNTPYQPIYTDDITNTNVVSP